MSADQNKVAENIANDSKPEQTQIVEGDGERGEQEQNQHKQNEQEQNEQKQNEQKQDGQEQNEQEQNEQEQNEQKQDEQEQDEQEQNEQKQDEQEQNEQKQDEQEQNEQKQDEQEQNEQKQDEQEQNEQKQNEQKQNQQEQDKKKQNEQERQEGLQRQTLEQRKKELEEQNERKQNAQPVDLQTQPPVDKEINKSAMATPNTTAQAKLPNNKPWPEKILEKYREKYPKEYSTPEQDPAQNNNMLMFPAKKDGVDFFAEVAKDDVDTEFLCTWVVDGKDEDDHIYSCGTGQTFQGSYAEIHAALTEAHLKAHDSSPEKSKLAAGLARISSFITPKPNPTTVLKTRFHNEIKQEEKKIKQKENATEIESEQVSRPSIPRN